MTQDQYDALTRDVINIVEQFNSELVTAAELVRYAANLNGQLPADLCDLNGVFDSNTGLRNPYVKQ